jgi:hypothetical protein
MASRALFSMIGLATALVLGGCGSSADDADSSEGAVQAASDLKLCAAVRGNGESILTHFASLSRIVDHYGRVDGMAGGSSGSITTFVYESILRSPSVHQCGDARCSADAEAGRIALELKSVQGYAEAVGDSAEGASVKGLFVALQKLKAEYDAKGITNLGPGDTALAAKRLLEVLSIPEVKEIVNPEAIAMLKDVLHLSFAVSEIKTSIEQLGAFSVDDNRLFFRTGVLNWAALAELFGRAGDFYAGYGPVDEAGKSAWLDACAESTRDMPWDDAAKVAMPDGGTCGEGLNKLVTDFRAKVRGAAAGSYHSRVDDTVGDPKSPLKKLVSTSVLEGNAVTQYETARAAYAKGQYPTGNVPFAPSFDDVHFGYWGNPSDLARVKSNPKGFTDLKTQKMSALGDVKWREILAASPAEPGLSRFVKLSDGRYSAGGWSDLAPSLALSNLGCEHVVYVTRTGDESGFAAKIAKNVGMSEADWKDLYDLSNPDSGYSRSVANADAVWCTRWNDFTDSQMSAEVLDAFNSPLETRRGFLSPLRPYDAVTEKTNRAGCTPGVSGGATYPQ